MYWLISKFQIVNFITQKSEFWKKYPCYILYRAYIFFIRWCIYPIFLWINLCLVVFFISLQRSWTTKRNDFILRRTYLFEPIIPSANQDHWPLKPGKHFYRDKPLAPEEWLIDFDHYPKSVVSDFDPGHARYKNQSRKITRKTWYT